MNALVKIEPMTSKECGGKSEELSVCYSFAESPFGKILIASTQKGVCSLSFSQSEKESLKYLKAKFPNAKFSKNFGIHQQKALLLFENKSKKPSKITLHLKGTPFQFKVWRALLEIPKGELTTYGAIAKTIGNPKAVRAVGSAVRRNPVAFIIPCHRIIPSTGGYGNYHWGPERKIAMLKQESEK